MGLGERERFAAGCAHHFQKWGGAAEELEDLEHLEDLALFGFFVSGVLVVGRRGGSSRGGAEGAEEGRGRGMKGVSHSSSVVSQEASGFGGRRARVEEPRD